MGDSALKIGLAHAGSSPSCPQVNRLPLQFHPALTEERLRLCARLLANTRRDALAMAAYEMGDDGWSVGCRHTRSGSSA